MKTVYLVPRDKVAKAFAAEAARCARIENGRSVVPVREINGITGETYRIVWRSRFTPNIRGEARKIEAGDRAHLRFFYVR